MNNIQEITLDIMNNKTYEYIYTKQYDVGRTVIFHITEDGEPWGESDISVVFQLKKPDGYVIIDNELEFNAADKTVTLVLDKQCTAVAGRLPYQLTFVKDNVILSTVSGRIVCEKAVVQRDEVKSKSSGNLIEDLISLYEDNVFQARRVALLASNWQNNQQTVEVPGVIPDEQHQLVIVRPANESIRAYNNSDIICSEQGTGTLSFECVTVPSEDIDVFVVVQGIDSRLGNIAFTYSSVAPNKYDQNEDDVWIQDYGDGEYSAEFMQTTDGSDPWRTPSSVVVNPKLDSGVNIADIIVDDVTYPLFAPTNTYNTLRIDDKNGDIVLTNNTTWDGEHASLKAAIMALQGGGGGGVTTVHLSPDEYAALTPEQKEDTSKIYFVDEEVNNVYNIS